MVQLATVQPTAAHLRRIAAEDARIMLASELRNMMWPGRIVVPVSMDDMYRIIGALEGE